ncbi:hypothetical protein OQJ26_13125 [Legionella sp. PATHC038]|uniref:hypothetical protein n=1 Tax=Legionella sheltonii TaxID=2992041 RepID=UPI002243BEF4|nr:hypothetical protein [Legionella sp. PATHC038]MCW8399733.1 hypothetical protein [Legionella sp. PATHC038]
MINQMPIHTPKFFNFKINDDHKNKEKNQPSQNDMIRIVFFGRNCDIKKGAFEGSLDLAQKAIQAFVDDKLLPFLQGKNLQTLINEHPLRDIISSVDEVDIPKVLEFCGIDESTLTHQLSMK